MVKEFASSSRSPSRACPPLAGVALSCYSGTIAAGYGEDYHPVVIRWLEQSAASGPQPDGGGDRARLVVLARAVTACQMLTTFEALRVMRAAGIAPSEAVAPSRERVQDR